MIPKKLRVFDKKNKQWLNILSYTDNEFSWNPVILTAFEDRVESFIMVQFTGLHDKNGKDVFEGDIVENWEGTKRGTVVWNKEWACFETTARFIEMNDEMEVIGNIYENPDLLKQ